MLAAMCARFDVALAPGQARAANIDGCLLVQDGRC